MKKQLLTLSLGVILSTSAMASDRSEQETKNELVGFGSGALAGAAVGGPIGAVVGGVFGILIADEVNDEGRMEDINQQLAKREAQLAERESQLVAMNQQLKAAEEKAQMQLVSMDKAIETVLQETESTIQFKTGSASIEPHYGSQLDLLAKHLSGNQNMILTLSGYADRRGDEQYNQTLSQERVQAVKHYLVSKGVQPGQLKTQAFGESSPVITQQSMEGDFFDRRVQMHLEEGAQSMTASTQQ